MSLTPTGPDSASKAPFNTFFPKRSAELQPYGMRSKPDITTFHDFSVADFLDLRDDLSPKHPVPFSLFLGEWPIIRFGMLSKVPLFLKAAV